MKNIAIGIDFSKKTFDATIVCRQEYRFEELAYCAFSNDTKGFRSFEKWVVNSLKANKLKSDKSS